MANDAQLNARVPACREDWAEMARRLGMRVIHAAERDTQTGSRRKSRDASVNTWSTGAFMDEGLKTGELVWGSHEKHWPDDVSRHGFGCDIAVYLNRPGIDAQVRSWMSLRGRSLLFVEVLDEEDPWQCLNFRVA